jgi:hypothetical protein
VADPLEQLRSWPATAAAGVTSAAGPIASAEPADQPFAWASVTKLLVALAELDAAQRGLIDLDEPAGPPGSTIRHLLSHASELGPEAGIACASLADWARQAWPLLSDDVLASCADDG